jgi:hypothetical protein
MEDVPEELREQVSKFLLSAIANGRKVPLDLARTAFGDDNQTGLANGLQAITSKIKLRDDHAPDTTNGQTLPTVVTFPYSRHSSYPELCHLVSAFKPRDVWPCTVDAPHWLREGKIAALNSMFHKS